MFNFWQGQNDLVDMCEINSTIVKKKMWSVLGSRASLIKYIEATIEKYYEFRFFNA